MRRRGAAAAAAVLLAAGLASCGGGGESDPAPSVQSSADARPTEETPTRARSSRDPRSADGPGTPTRRPSAAPEREPLDGRVVVLDPGHQLGNANHPAEINAPVDAGGLQKPCNTTGTATDDGYPEATFVWEVARLVAARLEAAGARVVLTRDSNSADAWGPCIDERGRAGNPGAPGPTADVKLSIHADGSYAAGAHGFHVIAPADVAPWTDDIAAPSLRLAEVLRDALVSAGFATSTYAGSQGVDVRSDLGTLNLADIPTVMVELGNMREPGEAAVMRSETGRERYARGLAEGLLGYLAR